MKVVFLPWTFPTELDCIKVGDWKSGWKYEIY